MTFLTVIIAALALEQFLPIGNRNRIFLWLTRLALFVRSRLDGGEKRYGVLAWCLVMFPLLLVIAGLDWGLDQVSSILSWLFNVGILYLCMGFRHFSSALTQITLAFKQNDLPSARAALQKWTQQPSLQLTRDEIARVAIEQGILDSYRHVFAILFWYTVCAGPLGAVLYRVASILHLRWRQQGQDDISEFGMFAQQVQSVLDWLPVRLTAFGFAVMGDFQDAVMCWQQQAAGWYHKNEGVLLASAAGALGIKLGDAVHQQHAVLFRPELGVGDTVEPEHLQSAIGLVWRTTVFWIAVILLISMFVSIAIIKVKAFA